MEVTITNTVDLIQAIRAGQSVLPSREGTIDEAGQGLPKYFPLFFLLTWLSGEKNIVSHMISTSQLLFLMSGPTFKAGLHRHQRVHPKSRTFFRKVLRLYGLAPIQFVPNDQAQLVGIYFLQKKTSLGKDMPLHVFQIRMAKKFVKLDTCGPLSRTRRELPA